MARHIRIQPGEVHLWWQALDEALGLDVLDAGERARVARYRSPVDASRFAARRTYARTVLARYAGLAPRDLRLRTGRHGKPDLDGVPGVSFSLSHADGMAVVAVAAGGAVGVDIERLRSLREARELAEQFFTPQEAEQVRAAADPTPAFLSLWTCKESLLKAIGVGLSAPLDRFDVSHRDADGRVRPIGPRGGLPFVIAALRCDRGIVGAVALKGEPERITDMEGGRIPW
jgi:4'-phosphopantetheinyl transferase